MTVPPWPKASSRLFPVTPAVVGVVLGVLGVLACHHLRRVDPGVVGLAGEVDAGHVPVAELGGRVLDGVLAVAAVGLVVVPELDTQVVEEDVARHREGLGHVDRATDLTFVVVVGRATRPAHRAPRDGVRPGVVEGVARGDETGLQRSRGGGELERRPRGVEALDGVVVQRARGLDGAEVGRGDPVGPPRRVVGRRRHQGQDRPRLGVEGDRRALGGLALERGDLGVERLLQGLLEPGVDVGHHVVARGGRCLAQAAHHLSVRVHLDLVGAGAAPQVRPGTGSRARSGRRGRRAGSPGSGWPGAAGS